MELLILIGLIALLLAVLFAALRAERPPEDEDHPPTLNTRNDRDH